MVSTRQVVGTTVATVEAQRPTRKGCPNRPVEFKRELAVAACAPGISVAKLALAHGLNTNLLFKWRRQYRAGQFGVPDPAHAVTLVSERPTLPSISQASPVRLLPVVEVATGVGVSEATGPEPACIEVVFACATVRICGVPEGASLRAVLNCLARCR